MAEKYRLVVVGGGVAGLEIATRLAGKRTGAQHLSVTLIDREPAYVWKPMLHTIAAGTVDAGLQETVFAARALTHGFRYEFGEAIRVDRQQHMVFLAPLTIEGEEIVPQRGVPYDTLVLSVGSRANDFGTPVSPRIVFGSTQGLTPWRSVTGCVCIWSRASLLEESSEWA